MKKLLLIIVLLTLTGCDYFVKPFENPPAIITEEHTEYLTQDVNIDAYLLEDCELLTALQEPISYESILVNVKENTVKYEECKNKHSALTKLLRNSLNIK